MSATSERPRPRELFARYPGTATLPWIGLASLPTPVRLLPSAALDAAVGSLWIKRDDVSSAAYGGNKVRKLEFLLGEALSLKAVDIITFGAAGSNHALATAIYGGRAGLRVHSMLLPQPNARYVRRNLLAAAGAGADMHHYVDRSRMLRGTARLRRALRERSGREPYVIPFGGTNAFSTVGFVNAGLELAAQVENRDLPEPDLVYVAMGSMGSAAGLALGMRAAGLRSKLVGVPIVSYEMNTGHAVLALAAETQELLRAADPAFPDFHWTAGDIEVANGFLGEEYARFTPAGAEAVRLAADAGLHLEGTYTGKALSALLAHGRAGMLEDKTVLFWNTYSSADISGLAVGDASSVPSRLRGYFVEAVQPLDRESR